MGKRKDKSGRVLRSGEYQRGNGSYEYKFRDIRKNTHSVYAKSLDELRLKEADIQRDIADGIDYSAGNITVSELVDRYISLKRTIKPNSMRAYSSSVNRIRESDFGRRKIRNVKKSDAQAWFVALHDSGLKRNTISIYKTVLQPAFEMAVDDDAIRKNPFRFNLSDLLPDDQTARPALTKTQQERYLNFIRTEANGNYYDDIVILLETGLRVSELYGITLDDVDLLRRRLSVRRQLCRTAENPYFICPPKTSSGLRTLPLSDRACEAFRHAIANRKQPQIEMMVDGITGFLFLDKDGRPKVAMHLENHMRLMREKYQKLYGNSLPVITPHVLRHTFCTNTQQAGLDPKSLQYLMGHSDPTITMALYTHSDIDHVEDAFRKALGS